MVEDKRAIRRIQLAQKIIQLAHQGSWEEGHHLTEIKLGEALGVSRSPVRSALALLEEWGGVISRPNQGYVLNANASDLLTMGQDAPPTMEDKLYLSIMDSRLAGDLGDIINQVEIMSIFDSPRNLTERVLTRLVEEGLMERRKGRGWQFLPTFNRLRSWENGYQLRLLVEPGGILLPQFHVDHEKLSACRIIHQDLLVSAEANIEPGDWVYSIDSNFHELIASFTNNAFFLQAIQNQNRLRKLLEFRGYVNRRRIVDWCQEHIAIINAIERGQMQKASELMRQHLLSAAEKTAELSPLSTT